MIENYAPVLIPTLNRYEHFKRCLESLERCTGSEYTMVYVALDYPPSDKYMDGWRKIDEYLRQKEELNKFKKIVVYRRDHNCGIGHLRSNGKLLIADVTESHGAYIFTEDDNEFSPNFLEYMNWGLETFKNDKSILEICGYNVADKTAINGNVYKYYRYSAWGAGTWVDKQQKLRSFYDFKKLRSHVSGLPFRIISNSKEVLHAFHVLRMIKRKTFYGDSIRGCLPINESMYIYPTISKVRNYGTDGSGQHGKGSKEEMLKFLNMEIDTSLKFIAQIGDEIECLREDKSYNQSNKKSIIRDIYYATTFLLWKLVRVNIS